MTPEQRADAHARWMAQRELRTRGHVESRAKRDKWDDLLAVGAETRRRWEARYGTEEAAVEGYESELDDQGLRSEERERDLTGRQ